MRKQQFVSGELYHIYNRGVDKRTIFQDQYDIARFLQGMREFNVVEPIGSIYEKTFGVPVSKNGKAEEPLVHFVAYCLNPNHFHFLLEQVAEGGISKFMHRLGLGHAMYFNEKYKRSGALFQGRFKAIHIDTNEYLLHLSAYINLNDRVHQLGDRDSKLVKSRSSWGEYLEGDKLVGSLCKKEIILEQFSSASQYKKFAKDALEQMVEQKRKEVEFGDLETGTPNELALLSLSQPL